MSVEAMTWAFRQPLAPAPKLVLLAIADACNRSGYGFPGLELLVEACQPMKRRMVQLHLRHLEQRRLLKRTARFLDYGKQTANGYQLALPGIDTTCWGEGVESCTPARGGGGYNSYYTLRVQQLLHPEGVTAITPTEDLNQVDERQEEHSVGLVPDGAPDLWIVAEGILGFLNRKSGRRYQARHPNKDPTTSLRLVHRLLVKGYREEQVRQVIGNRLVRWGADPKMREFLRPKTLFAGENFEQYLGEVGAA